MRSNPLAWIVGVIILLWLFMRKKVAASNVATATPIQSLPKLNPVDMPAGGSFGGGGATTSWLTKLTEPSIPITEPSIPPKIATGSDYMDKPVIIDPIVGRNNEAFVPSILTVVSEPINSAFEFQLSNIKSAYIRENPAALRDGNGGIIRGCSDCGDEIN